MECKDHNPPAVCDRENCTIVPVLRGGSLPMFKIQGFVRGVAVGSRREAKRVEEEQRRKGEERRARAKEREVKTAMWTTSGMRPLVEAPEMDRDWYKRKVEISKRRYQRLFPGNVALQSEMEDLDAQFRPLSHYTKWAETMSLDSDTPKDRKAFYLQLHEDTMLEFMDVRAERARVLSRAAPLGKFEYLFFDNDLGTTELEKKLKSEAGSFDIYGEETTMKYSHPVPWRIISPLVFNEAATDWNSTGPPHSSCPCLYSEFRHP